MSKSRHLMSVALATVAVAVPVAIAFAGPNLKSSPLQFTATDIDGKTVPLSKYKGKVVMIVNTASKCGFTPQYAALEKIYQKYRAKGFVVLAFPANNFGGQEPGANPEIKTFCTSQYHTTFPLFGKVSVVGADQAPLYRFLTDKKTNPTSGGRIEWNFTKFVVGRDAQLKGRFASPVTPDSAEVTALLERELATPAPKG